MQTFAIATETLEEKLLKFRLATVVVAALVAAGAVSSVQAAVPAAGQSRITKAPIVDLGVAPADTVRKIAIALPLRNGAALDAYIASTADPASPNFRQFLTTAQFADAYGATADSLAQVQSYLAANGIAVKSVSGNRLMIIATANNAQLSSLFGTAIHLYSQDGRTFQRPVGNVVLPAGLKGLVTSVSGLSSQPLVRSNLKFMPRTGPLSVETSMVATAQPMDASTNVTSTGIPGKLTTGDVMNLYNGKPLVARGVTGNGTTLGIMTFAGFDQADAYGYWNAIRQPVLADRITEINVGDNVASPADNGADETSLDVEQAGGISPRAKIRVYEAANDDVGALMLYDTAISENLCDTLSISWGMAEIMEDPSVFPIYDAMLRQAAVQGTPLMASSGDSGAYDINRSTFLYPQFNALLTVDFPASHPMVLAAGGTTLPAKFKFNDGTPLVIAAERPWGLDYLRDYYVSHYGQAVYYTELFPVGGGGGVSVVYPVPAYQAGLPGVKTSSAGQSLIGPGTYNPTTHTFGGPIVDWIDMPGNFAGRNVPDVSLNADSNTGYYLAFGGYLYTQGGGTSFVAPQLNGIFSLITQQAGKRLGWLNPQLYAAYRAKGYGAGSPFRAIGAGTNLYYQGTSSYNPATGLGVLNIDNLSNVLAPATPK